MIYAIVCAEWRCGPFATREEAERRLAQIEASRRCPLDHVVEEQ